MAILIHKDFSFIVQGITGREAVNFTRECLEYGSKIVGGVTPGRGGRVVYDVPVYNTVREITAKQKVDGALDWSAVWYFPAIMAAVVMIAFAVLFRNGGDREHA